MGNGDSSTLREFFEDLCGRPEMRSILARRVASDPRLREAVVIELIKGQKDDSSRTQIPDTVVNILQQFMALPADVAQRYADTGELPTGAWLVPAKRGR